MDNEPIKSDSIVKMMNSNESKWFEFYIDGSDVSIGLKIRPLCSKVLFDLILKHSIKKKRKEYKIKGVNFLNASYELLDYLLEDFAGVGDENNKPLQVTPENKKKLLNLPLEYKKQNIGVFIIQKSAELYGMFNVPISNERILISQMNKYIKKRKRNVR